MQWSRDRYEIDSTRERIDLEQVGTWLRGSYWASTRSQAAIELSWQSSACVFGIYDGHRMIGCARVVSDRVAIAYLADVFLLPEYRGQGLGQWLVETIIRHPDLQNVGFLLHTRDMHALYQKVGFASPDHRVMERPRP